MFFKITLKKYDRRKGFQQSQSFFDSRIQRVRADRQALDNALAAYHTTWSSLIGQLVDLEGVIEETGNDVLRGRCRITLQMVSALEERLHLASSAIEFCCGECQFEYRHSLIFNLSIRDCMELNLLLAMCFR